MQKIKTGKVTTGSERKVFRDRIKRLIERGNRAGAKELQEEERLRRQGNRRKERLDRTQRIHSPITNKSKKSRNNQTQLEAVQDSRYNNYLLQLDRYREKLEEFQKNLIAVHTNPGMVFTNFELEENLSNDLFEMDPKPNFRSLSEHDLHKIQKSLERLIDQLKTNIISECSRKKNWSQEQINQFVLNMMMPDRNLPLAPILSIYMRKQFPLVAPNINPRSPSSSLPHISNHLNARIGH